MRLDFILVTILGTGLCSTIANAEVTRYINKLNWQTAIGSHVAVTFQGFEKHTVITEQYSSLGVLFGDGNDAIRMSPSLLNDGVGLSSNDSIYGIITMQFTQPIHAVACEFLGDIDMQLYSNGELIYQSSVFDTVQSRFGGLISSAPFDKAIIRDPSDSVVVIDDLYFGPPIPAPGALALLGLAAMVGPRRRR